MARKLRLPPLIFLLVAIGTGALAGCRAFSEKSDPVTQYEQMRERQRWWDQQRHRAEYVSGRGYYLPETGQYYNESGQPIGDAGDQVQAASFEEDESSVAPPPAAEEGSALKRLAPKSIVSQIKKATGNGPSRERAREKFQRADNTYREAMTSADDARKRRLRDAAKLYAAAAENWPSSAIEEDAMFKVGECYYFVDDYPEAEDRYSELVKKYPNTRYLDLISARRFKIAGYWLNEHVQEKKRRMRPNLTNRALPWLDTFGHSVKLFDRIRIDDPAGKLADDATIAAANAYFRAEKYQRAEELYTDVRQAFPDSEHQFEAHLLGLKCKLLTYQGPDYDRSNLNEADKLATQIKRQFRQAYSEQREMIDRTHAEVRARLAEQEWNRAKYHERRGEFQGAQHYYERLIADFPTTDIAQSARERIAEIGNKSAQPPSRLSAMWKYIDYGSEDLPPLKSVPAATIRR